MGKRVHVPKFMCGRCYQYLPEGHEQRSGESRRTREEAEAVVTADAKGSGGSAPDMLPEGDSKGDGGTAASRRGLVTFTHRLDDPFWT